MILDGSEAEAGWDFPSALQRFLMAVGVEMRLCPPQQPQKNAFVERYHRNYKYECLLVHVPQSLEEVRRVTEQYQQHYNEQRPRKATRLCQSTTTSGIPHAAHPAFAARHRAG